VKTSGRIDRRLARVRKVRKNCSFGDIERLLLALGFDERMSRGSHVIFSHRGVTVSVPRQRRVKRHYVEEVLEIAEALLASDNENHT
jgi:predicted RNA binding protein YcfA (HicA-like mRNA interferase family)